MSEHDPNLVTSETKKRRYDTTITTIKTATSTTYPSTPVTSSYTRTVATRGRRFSLDPSTPTRFTYPAIKLSVPGDLKHVLSPYDEEEAKIAFSLFDPDGKGYITPEGVERVLKTLGDQTNDEFVKQLLDDVDKNFDGKIDFKEFCNLFSKLKRKEIEGDLRKAWGSRENLVSVQEFRRLVESMAHNFRETEIQELIRDVKSDNGFVDFHRFLNVIITKYKRNQLIRDSDKGLVLLKESEIQRDMDITELAEREKMREREIRESIRAENDETVRIYKERTEASDVNIDSLVLTIKSQKGTLDEKQRQIEDFKGRLDQFIEELRIERENRLKLEKEIIARIREESSRNKTQEELLKKHKQQIKELEQELLIKLHLEDELKRKINELDSMNQSLVVSLQTTETKYHEERVSSETKSKTISRLEHDLEELRAARDREVRSLNVDIQRKSERITELEREFEALKSKVSSLTYENRTLLEERKSLEEKYLKLKTEHDALLELHYPTAGVIANLKKKISELESRVTYLTEELERERERTAAERTAKETLIVQRRELEQTNRVLVEKNEMLIRTERELTSEINSLRDLLTKRQAEISHLRSSNEEQRLEIESLRRKVAELIEAQRRLEESSRIALEEISQECLKKVQDIKAEAQAISDRLTLLLEQEEKKNKHLQAQLNHERDERAKLQKSYDALLIEIRELRIEVTGLKTENGKLSAEKSRLLTNIQQLEYELKELTEKWETKYAEIERERTKLLLELEKLRKEVDILRHEKASLLETIERLERDNRKLSTEYSELSVRFSHMEEEYKKRIHSLESEIRNFEREIASIKAQFEQKEENYKKRIQNLEAEVRGLEKELSSLRVQYNQLEESYQKKLSSLEVEIRRLERELSVLRTQYDELKVQKATADRLIVDLHEKIQSLNASLDSLRVELAKKDKTIEELKAKLAHIAAEYEAQIQELKAKMEREIRILTRQLEEKTQIELRLRADVESLNKTVKELEEEIKKMMRKLEFKSKRLLQFIELVSSWKTILKQLQGVEKSFEEEIGRMILLAQVVTKEEREESVTITTYA